jgi:ring-1,2-phenylacetyl-CoA epoxidase subunit PaaD
MVDQKFSIIPADIQKALAEVFDPEIPVLSVLDLGVITGVEVEGKNVLVKLSPTYSGCPAMDTMSIDIRLAIDELGYKTKIELVLSPAWTTDLISPKGRQALEAYGIAAPLGEEADKLALINGQRIVKCTRCGSTNTKMISQFGSTACKALFKCEDCLEPFDYFKCLK